MTIRELNNILSTLGQNPPRDKVLEFSFALIEWMGLKPNSDTKPQLLTPQTQKLKDYLFPAPQTVQPQLYRLSAEGQNIRVRFAVLKKLKKEYISQLVDNDPGLGSYQAISKGLTQATDGTAFIPPQPYFIHFVTTPDYDRLVLIFNQGDQKRIVSFRNRLTNTQYNKIILQWQNIATKPKLEIVDLLWKSLDIKEVNKEFYKQIKERFDALLGIVKTQHNHATANQVKQFTVRLIGRYIFCWFLKEKGTISLELIGKKAIAEINSYYQKTLLKLFFETLNTKVQDRNPLTHEKLFEKIPYLNGGLFDESEEDKLFTELDLDAWLLPFVEILESYDFTVDESSSQYQQVAVDPEMLGLIFENLLASQNEETEKLANQRKAFGAFYTPREIVDYMVNESIKAYLQTQWEQQIIKERTKHSNDSEVAGDIPGNRKPQHSTIEAKHYKLRIEDTARIEKALEPLFIYNADATHLKKEEKALLLFFLERIKILDPACGSGAFPMGILHKLVELNELLGTVKTGYELKKDILSQNIYGVDIMPMAIEIARLRAWLSLVLEEDYKPNDPKHNFGVKPLPNLDFKFVCANSLIDLGLDTFIKESKGTLHEGFTQKLVIRLKDLENLRKSFFIPDLASAEKEKIKTEYLKKRDEVVTAIEADSDPILKQIAQKIKVWNPFDDSHPSPFFSPTWMFGIEKGFDVVIGNPPYVQLQNNNGKLASLYLSENYQTFARRGDIYALFYEKGTQFLRKKGILSFITSNKWMRAAYGEKLRAYFTNQLNPIQLIDFGGYQVFDATVDTNILIAEKAPFQNMVKTCVLNKDASLNNMSDYFRQNSRITSFSAEDSWVVLSGIEQSIKSKIEKIGKPLKDWDVNIYRGILTGYNDAFIIDSVTKDKLIADSPNSVEIIRPILRGRDIHKYYCDSPNQWVIFIPWHFPLHEDETVKGASLAAEQAFQEEYPTIYNHLLSHKQSLENRNKAETGIRYEWYALQRFGANYWKEFEKTKIVWGNLSLRGAYSLAEKGVYINAPSAFIPTENLYLLAMLNSKIADFYIKQLGVTRNGGYFEYKPMFVEQLPVPIISKEQEEKFSKLVAQRIKYKDTDVSEIDSQLDNMACDLFGLTAEEKEFVYNAADSMKAIS